MVALLAKGGFNLTKCVSNITHLPAELQQSGELAPTDEKVIPKPDESSHVLGLKWNHACDTLVVSRGTSPVANKKVTQRVVLSVVSAVYDPLGLVAPFTVQARLLLNDIWRLSGQQWDDDLPNEIVTKFNEWSKELPTLSELQIPRSYFEERVETLELHIFGHSSQDFFSAIAFLRGKRATTTGYATELAFVFAKARAAPMKALTIPKLEIQASLLAARLRKEIENALTVRVDNTFLWTDSTTVLQWLQL